MKIQIKTVIKMAIFKKRDKDLNLEDYVEVPIQLDEQKGVKIVIEKLENFAAVDRVVKKLREGNIVIVKIKEMRESNLDELKHSVSKLRTVCSSMQGDIVGVGDEWVILTPANARIER